MRLLLPGLLLLVPLVHSGQSQTMLTITVRPARYVARSSPTAIISGLSSGTGSLCVLLTPDGQEEVLPMTVAPDGTSDLTLNPPNQGWWPGIYRVVVRSAGQTASTTFSVDDGQPRLLVEPSLPSPFSAFYVQGVALPADKQFDLVLHLTGGENGSFSETIFTSDQGSFSSWIWPQEVGASFFAAGPYTVSLPAVPVSTGFTVREHPGGAALAVSPDAAAATETNLKLSGYQPNRYVWGVYASSSGQELGEFLAGPTASNGSIDTVLSLPTLPTGTYLVATPYDWGETSFHIVAADPPTSTPTATASATPTATATPKPKHHHHHHRSCRPGHHRVHGKCHPCTKMSKCK